MDNCYCSILLPVYNELDSIKDNLGGILKTLSSILKGKSFEVLLLENGSHPFVQHSLRTMYDNHPIIKVTCMDHKGRGLALKKGFEIAKGEFIAILSIDRAWNESFLKDALFCLQNESVDIVFGPKTHPHSRVKRPRFRNYASIFIRFALTLMFRTNWRDTQCVKVFKKSNIPFLSELISTNYFSEAEFFIRARDANIPYRDIAVDVVDKRKTSKIKLSSFFEFFKEAFIFKGAYES